MNKLALLLSLLALGALGVVACGEATTIRPPQRPRPRPRVTNSPPITSPAAPLAAIGSRWLKATFRVAWRMA
jgi:hypothetical protein